MPRKWLVVRQERTPHAVYATTFSPSGGELACAGGYFYGHGFLFVIGESGEGQVARHCEDLDATISGLCFDRTARLVAASLWSKRHHYHPSAIFGIEGSQSRAWFEDAHDRFGRYCATGILARGHALVVRHGSSMDRPVSVHALPAAFVAAEQGQLTSSRVTAFGSSVATGVAVESWTGVEGATTKPMLAVTDLRNTPEPITRCIGTPHEGGIAAIAADEARGEMVTGGADGSVAFWSLPGSGGEEDPSVRSVVRHHRHAVAATCFMADGSVVTADLRGLVQLWEDSEPTASWMAAGWSPRTLAAHPQRLRLAVGCKYRSSGGREGLAAVLDIGAGR
jgi:hypothetical protein